jgi:hypothetical protein
MKNKFIGAIGIFWGGAIVARWFLADNAPVAEGAYQTGQTVAVVFGLFMLLAGLYYFFKQN